MKLNILIALVTIGFMGCSGSSSNDGGGNAAKPDLKPAKEVMGGFSIVKEAGQQGAEKSLSISETNPNSMPPVDEKVRAKELSKIVSDTSRCQVEFSNPNSKRPGSPNQGFMPELDMKLKIDGSNCPLSAEYNMKTSMQVSKMKMNLDYKFVVKQASIKSLVGATAAVLKGGFEVNPSADGQSVDGGGQMLGFVENNNFGRVSLKADFLLSIKSGRGQQVETLAFAFPEAQRNVTLKKVVNYQNNSEQCPVYYANDVRISRSEYESVVGGLLTPDTAANSNSSTESTGSQCDQEQSSKPSPSEETLDQWKNQSLVVTVVDGESLAKATLRGGQSDFVFLDGRVVRNENLENSVSAENPACVVSLLSRSGRYRVENVQIENQNEYYFLKVSLERGMTIECVSKNAPVLYSKQVQRSFGRALILNR